MRPWVCIPTAQRDHVPAQLSKWSGRGWEIALWLDFAPSSEIHQFAPFKIQGRYPGVWRAWNALARSVVACGTEVVCLAGDDMDPPSQPAEEIARMYLERFPTGLGVLQGTGDRQGDIIDGKRNSGRICGSPIVGREWVKRAYHGEGPVNGRYWGFYADEELLHVAQKLGVLWQEPSITIFHRHWSWRHLPKQDYHERNNKSWAADKVLFEASKAAGFPEGGLLW